MAENPETWDEIDKAILVILHEHEAEANAGIPGNTLPVKLGNYVRLMMRTQRAASIDEVLAKLVALDSATRLPRDSDPDTATATDTDTEAKLKARHDQMLARLKARHDQMIDGGGA